jgi:hypothetical protein
MQRFHLLKIKVLVFIRSILASHIVPRIRYLGFITRGKKGPLTTTEDLSACKSTWSLIRIYTVNKPLFLAPLPRNKWSRFDFFIAFCVIFSFLLVFLFSSTNFWSSSKSIYSSLSNPSFLRSVFIFHFCIFCLSLTLTGDGRLPLQQTW